MFANISQADKEAFFSLLDEYFATRGGVAAVAAAKGPAGQQALSRLQSGATHLKSDFGKHFGGTGGHSSSTAASAEPAAPAASGHADAHSSADATDRPSFAALRGAFSNASTAIMSGAGAAGLGRSNTSASSAAGPKVPPPVAPRNRFQAPAAAPQSPPEPEEDDPPPPVIPKRSVAPPAPASRAPAGLQSGKHIGGSKIDITSGGSIVSSMFSSKKAPTTSMPLPPPSSAPKSNYSFAPPPVRRAPSSNASETPAASTPPPPPPPPPPPAPTRGQEPEEEGEWVEALYEYTSDDKTDLQFDAGARIKVIEHTSDDWWTGEIKGMQGLFPATYVKTL
ncbi:hypothetical protein M407DRAFT_241987 [Tulasnella calospora MUT 4182]|uniref:SH3 domain-containing protein n=1 Tax=Tulasnella calospora MUT 4182 TaxID=1051891 RepID=A0A0C3QSS5_9AGAM|nr:hypothetical protein M407DRAFT_241987 [Tulasnella calospora MUT 4182]